MRPALAIALRCLLISACVCVGLSAFGQGLDPQTAGAGIQQNGGAQDLSQYEHMLVRDPIQPDFLPLSAEHEAYLGQLLDYWEKTSGNVKRLTCDFQRWDYFPSSCNWRSPADNRLAAARIVRGRVMFASPDQADVQSTEHWAFSGPKTDNPSEAAYQKVESAETQERWTCDGRGIYEYDFTNKRLYETAIPPEQQGQALANSPLPFLFGAKRSELMDRFWMRPVPTPRDVKDEYWIEAWPKRRDDAVNYQRVEIILSATNFLPKSIHIYSRDYDAARNPVSQFFEFSNIRVNDQLSGIRDFFGVFIRPQTPIGWERVPVSQLQQPASGTANLPGDPASRGAQLPTPGQVGR